LYIVTFYSYRGGVGRSTALVNVGLELVQRGRKVLLVDFDLESPDLTNFPPLTRPEPHPGLVEYVAAYRETEKSPVVTEYLYPVKAPGDKGGQLWVMPAGRVDPQYWETLAEIDWQALYDRNEGYLFFEDTREQWRELGPDYVLIDSHAGITPPLGISTRQLADAVVMVFNPRQKNEERVLEFSNRIHKEAEQTGRKPIEQFFVATGVVEADEMPAYLRDVYLWDLMNDETATTISFSHRLLLGQQIAVGKLDQDYRRLANLLAMANFAQDKDGARALLCEIHSAPARTVGIQSPYTSSALRTSFDKLEQIIKGFPKDADIQAQAACCLYGAARYGRALAVLDEAVELRPDSPELLWQRASYRYRLGLKQGAVKDLLHLFELRAKIATGPRLSIGVETERGSKGIEKEEIPENAGLTKNEIEDLFDRMPGQPYRPRFALPEEFEEGKARATPLPDYSDPLLQISGVDPYMASALRQLRELDAEKYEQAKNNPYLSRLPSETQRRLFAEQLHDQDDIPDLVRSRKWAEVVTLLRPWEEPDLLTLPDAYHLFMALWGLGIEKELRGFADKAIKRFRQYLAAPSFSEHLLESDYQIMSLVFWKTGDRDKAEELLEKVLNLDTEEDEKRRTGKPFLSYWWYDWVSWKKFKEDCLDQRQMMRGGTFSPPFLGKEPTNR